MVFHYCRLSRRHGAADGQHLCWYPYWHYWCFGRSPDATGWICYFRSLPCGCNDWFRPMLHSIWSYLLGSQHRHCLLCRSSSRVPGEPSAALATNGFGLEGGIPNGIRVLGIISQHLFLSEIQKRIENEKAPRSSVIGASFIRKQHMMSSTVKYVI